MKFVLCSRDDYDWARGVLAEHRLEHRRLDDEIARLALDPGSDELLVKRLKKRKLLLKDAIARLESQLIPDLDA